MTAAHKPPPQVFAVINAAAVMPTSLARLFARGLENNRRVMRKHLCPRIGALREMAARGEDTGHEVLGVMVRHASADGAPAEAIADQFLNLVLASMAATAGVLTHVL